jgi:phosphoglycolate phosphatase
VGAAAHGLPCVGVLWGYGSAEELLGAGAVALATDVDELLSLLLS